MAQLKLNNKDAWIAAPRAAGRRSARKTSDAFPERFLAAGVTIADEQAYQSDPSRRAGGVAMLDLSVTGAAGEAYVLAVRHESGALTFHEGVRAPAAVRRTGAAARTETRFQVHVRSGARRGVAGRVVRAILLRVADVVIGASLRVLVRAWEESRWRREGLTEGFVRFDEAGLRAGRLAPAAPRAVNTPAGRALLLLHGTFSETIGSFKELQNTAFFAEARKRYGGEIYGYNHFSLSKSAEENARDLVRALPDDAPIFDVATYSRGGLVVRNLVERAHALGPEAARFRVGRVVLVASPNEGTPLATPARWKETVGWVATLLDHFPETPWTVGAAFVAEAITWIAAKAVDAAPGLESMDAGGEQIAELQEPPSVGADMYSALIANFTPDRNLALKLLDVGIDAFFAGANDLVVPTDGGWRVDPTASAPLVPPERVCCFGPGGNVAAVGAGAHHLNFFRRNESTRFMLGALAGEAMEFPPYGSGAQSRRGVAVGRDAGVRSFDAGADAEPPVGGAQAPAPRVFSDSLHLTVLQTGPDVDAVLYAQYAGARVIEQFRTRGGEAGARWQKIIAHDRYIRAYIEGAPRAKPPTDERLREYGRVLFETLFPGDVKRLYDIARSREDVSEVAKPGGSHLNVIFTSVVPWVADIPWEFAFDATRRTYLATEEIRFIRNALTSVPAERLRGQAGALRILVASAQPIGAGRLSIEEEDAVIRRGFAHLEAAGIAEIGALPNATPAALHERLISKPYDVLHFIGHGEYDQEEQAGYLLFEGANGEEVRLGARQLREMTRGRGLQLVFLNACETGVRGQADFNRGIAPELVDTGIHCVVANQYSVLDSSATEFAQVFYWMLAQGATIGAAAREARIALNCSLTGENIDWAVPVVYARNPESQLTTVRAATAGMTATAAKKHSRRGRRTRSLIGVWDLNNVFPEIEQTLARLNEVQARFEFDLVEASAPLGIMQQTFDGDRQLHADIVSRRLKRLPQELGAEMLYCITRHLIMYERGKEEFWNNYNWWPDKQKDEPVLIASAWHPELPASGPLAHRAVANLLVQGLAGYLADEVAHGRGVKSCPLYRNDELDIGLVVGAQKFDPACHRRLRRKLGEDLDALDAMLTAFAAAA